MYESLEMCRQIPLLCVCYASLVMTPICFTAVASEAASSDPLVSLLDRLRLGSHAEPDVLGGERTRPLYGHVPTDSGAPGDAGASRQDAAEVCLCTRKSVYEANMKPKSTCTSVCVVLLAHRNTRTSC